MMGPFDDEDNDDVLYVGTPDELPDIWADSTVILDDED